VSVIIEFLQILNALLPTEVILIISAGILFMVYFKVKNRREKWKAKRQKSSE